MVREGVSRWDDWDVDTMVAIATAESNCRADALGDTDITYENNDRTYGYSIGALQLRILEGREWMETGDYYEAAHTVWAGQGYQAWSAYTNGKYLQYMP